MPKLPKFKMPVLSGLSGLWLWLGVLIFLGVVIQSFQTKKGVPKKETYSSFMTLLEKKEITEVSFIGDSKSMRGTLKTPIDSAGLSYALVQADLPVRNSDAILARVEAAKVPIRSIPASESVWMLLVKLIPTLFLFGFFVYIIRSSQGPGRAASMFGQNRNKLIAEIPLVTFADVAGADEAKQELQEMVEFLKEPSLITNLGGKMPKGALLIGPPGTGKTLLAKAVAGEAGRPFFSMSGSDFVEMFVGVGASRVRDLFKQAKAHAPCIVFIDEIDAVGRARGMGTGNGHDEREQTLNQLLVEMDGFIPTEGIIVLAATNRPDILDSALMRPGRFDRQVTIDLPDTKGREAILTVHAKNHPLDPEVNLRQIARGTPGMSGADLANLLNEAAVLAARRNQTVVTLKEMEDAKDKLILGLERRSMVLSDFERRLTAYHEAGHALISLLTVGADPLHKVTIIPRGRAMGVTASLPDTDRHTYTRRWMKDVLVMLFGGRAAEELILGEEEITTGASNDIERATDLARRYVTSFGMSEKLGLMNVPESSPEGHQHGRAQASEKTRELVDQEVRSLLHASYQTALELLRKHNSSLHTLAEALLARETLSREDILAILPAMPHHHDPTSAPAVGPPPLLVA